MNPHLNVEAIPHLGAPTTDLALLLSHLDKFRVQGLGFLVKGPGCGVKGIHRAFFWGHLKAPNDSGFSKGRTRALGLHQPYTASALDYLLKS